MQKLGWGNWLNSKWAKDRAETRFDKQVEGTAEQSHSLPLFFPHRTLIAGNPGLNALLLKAD
jgi:hypothetical protein